MAYVGTLLSMKKQERLDGFVREIWAWYARNKRELPWRDSTIKNDTERAYRVLVSEIMLQQTQVIRVKIVFRNFLERFPSVRDLADVTNKDVILAWRGMGYNSRALRLRDAARSITHDFGGIFPQDMEQLLSINGLGPYTAAAVRNFAFDIPTPCIDTNIRRILHRTFVGPENADGTWETGDRELLKIAEEVLGVAIKPPSPRPSPASGRGWSEGPGEGARTTANWHAALMDYGSLVQTKNNPRWDICVLTEARLMKTTPGNWQRPVRGEAKKRIACEPGRLVGSVFIPNRIFRGKIVEALRDADSGLTPDQVGAIVCMDWHIDHKTWLKSLITKLIQENILAEKKGKLVLAD